MESWLVGRRPQPRHGDVGDVVQQGGINPSTLRRDGMIGYALLGQERSQFLVEFDDFIE